MFVCLTAAAVTCCWRCCCMQYYVILFFCRLQNFNFFPICYAIGVINFFVEYIPKTLSAGFVALDKTNIFYTTTLSKNASPSCLLLRSTRMFLALSPHFSEKFNRKIWPPLMKIGSIRILFILDSILYPQKWRSPRIFQKS